MEKNENHMDYHQGLNQALASLELEPVNCFLASDGNGYQEALFKCDYSFFGKIQRDLIILKRKLLQLAAEKLPVLEEKEVQIFKAKIKPLSAPTSNVIKEQIITVYYEFLQVAENVEKVSQNEYFSELIRNSIKLLEPALRDHIILRRLSVCSNATSKLKKPLSQKSINLETITEMVKDEHVEEKFQQISKEIEDILLQDLLNEEMEDEENELSLRLETCRICEGRIPLGKLEKHLNYCSKKQSYKTARNEIIERQDEVVQEIKMKLSKGTKNEQTSKIYRAIIMSFSKQERLMRRRSSFSLKKGEEINKILDEFEKKFDADQTLAKFKKLDDERNSIENKIQSLQVHYLSNTFEGSEFSKSHRSSLQNISQKGRKVQSIKTKKSIFAAAKSEEEESKDSGTEKNIDLEYLGVKKWKSIKQKEFEDMVSFFQINEEKMYKSLTLIKSQEEPKIETKFSNFQLLKFLGKGAFGKVYLVRRKNTQDLYAMKVIQIQDNWGEEEHKLIRNEHETLRKIAGDHLVKAPFSFNEGCAHFFVLDYMPGGDLSQLLEEEVYFEEAEAKFYLAQIVLALEHLHNFGIIHRDLKPENLVIDDKGHLKLTDFGLSQIRINDKISKVRLLGSQNAEPLSSLKKKSINEAGKNHRPKLMEKKSNMKIIGTPDYIAPEIIKKTSIDNPSIDWWSLGVLAYEMMVGCRPFADDTIEEVLNNIIEFKITWPDIGSGDQSISEEAADLIKKLLNPIYEERLGAKSTEEIKNHPFFFGIQWENVRYQKAPFSPHTEPVDFNLLQADEQLCSEVQDIINFKETTHHPKLSNFIRYDLLMNQTLESAGKIIEQHGERISKLKSLVKGHSRSNKRASIEMKPIIFNIGDSEQSDC